MLMVAAALLLLLGVAAMVVDLGGIRFDIRADRLATDASATAGAAAINPFAGSRADVACTDAWSYLLLNLGEDSSGASPPNCTTFATACVPAVARTETASVGVYTVTFTHPVPDAHDLMGGQSLNSEFDGSPCQRFGVQLTKTRDFTFAAALGASGGETTVRSVARIGAGRGAGEVVPLLVLEPIACDALYTSGQGGITVSYFEDSPGFIVVDSDASKSDQPNTCSGNNRWSIDAQGNQNGWIRALPTPEGIPSAILSYALSYQPGAQPDKAYDPSDLTSPVAVFDPADPVESRFRLYPEPQGVTRRVTRAPIDWRYNCKGSYPGYPIDLDDPTLGTIEIGPCTDTGSAHIDALVTSYGTGAAIPGSFNVLTNCWPATDLYLEGDWYVDCPDDAVNDGLVVQNVDVTFASGNVVFAGPIDLRASGRMCINPTPDQDRFVYVRDGDLKKGAQSSISLNHTFVYLENGVVDLVGGDSGTDLCDPLQGESGGLIWTAPLGGDFEDLALWSESSNVHQIGGQANNTLTGTFFTPLANPFTLTGQGGQFQTDAQFLTRRLEVKGQGEVRMKPDPDRQTLIPIREVFLIR